MAKANHHVTHAVDGEDGMARALAERFDVMIFDRQLPGGVDGANLLKALRERRISTPGIVPVRVGGIAGLDDRAGCRGR